MLAARQTALYRARMYLHRHRPEAFGAAIATILVAGITVWSLLRRQPPPTPKLNEKRIVVLADFANATGDPTLTGTLCQVLTAELGNSANLVALSDTRVSATLRLMLRAPDTKLTPEIASEICEQTGSAAVVQGSIAGIGSETLLELRARNCRTGDLLDKEQASTVKKEDVVQVFGEVANRFRTRTAESLPSVKREPSLPTEVTTASLEAWRSYSAAMTALQHKAQAAETIPLLKRATEIDPQFAMAYADLGRLYASLGESELGAQSITKAYELRNRVSDRENYYITFNYHRQVARNLELARQTLESWI